MNISKELKDKISGRQKFTYNSLFLFYMKKINKNFYKN